MITLWQLSLHPVSYKKHSIALAMITFRSLTKKAPGTHCKENHKIVWKYSSVLFFSSNANLQEIEK